VKQLLAAQAATVVHNASDLARFLNTNLQNPELMSETADRAMRIIEEGSGSGQATAAAIARLLAAPESLEHQAKAAA